MNIPNSVRVAFISRLDYGSKGYRKYLVDAAFDICKQENVQLVILIGGLVDKTEIKQRIKDRTKKELRRDKIEKRTFEEEDGEELLPAERTYKRKQKLASEVLVEVAKELEGVFPKFTVFDHAKPKKERIADIFVITSPAFDGEEGEIIAQTLAGLRPDIRVWDVGGERFPIKYVDKVIQTLAPEKATWMRSDYYSTPVERVIKDTLKQSSERGSPDIHAVGGFGSGLHKTRGELEYAYTSVPVLHKITKTRVNENQIGVGILEFPLDGSPELYTVYNLKDLVSNELSFIVPPDKITKLQSQMLDVMKIRGKVTPGILKYKLDQKRLVSSARIVQEWNELAKRKADGEKNWPGIKFHETGKKYEFDINEIQHRLRCPIPNGPWVEDRILSFACLHAGSIETDYEFFVRDVPEYILRQKVRTLVGAGDIKEGTAHNLMMKGEIVAGMDNTDQEKVAAHLIGTVVLKVFTARFIEEMETQASKRVHFDFSEAITRSLLDFYYIPGNHDLWESHEGHKPLVVFHFALVDFLMTHIRKVLDEHAPRASFVPLHEIVKKKVQMADYFSLPSGLRVSLQHPHMARAKTTSLRPQEMLAYAKRAGCQVVIGANFHVSENVTHWDMDLGQRVCQEIGTVKHGSNFERHKMKIVDQGVGYLRVLSSRDMDGTSRIFLTQSAFYGEPRVVEPVSNLAILNGFVVKLGVSPIV